MIPMAMVDAVEDLSRLSEIEILRAKNIESIALVLSRIPRFGGHTVFPYYVAQHCCLVADMAETLGGLMHDACEVVTGDIPAPVRGFVNVDPLEAKLLDIIDAAFGCKTRSRAVMVADGIATATELSQLFAYDMPTRCILWQPLDHEITCWSSEQAYSEFMLRYERLK